MTDKKPSEHTPLTCPSICPACPFCAREAQAECSDPACHVPAFPPVKSFEEMTNEEFEACPDTPEKQDYIVSLYQAANQAHTRPGPGDALRLGGTQSVSD